jgi:hypothetical protein
MRHPVHISYADLPESFTAIRSTFAGRYARLRIPQTAIRHTENQLTKFERTLDRWGFPPVVIGDKGKVLSGFGIAQLVNQSILGRYVWTTKYSRMTDSDIRDYIRSVKKIARLEKWGKKMLAVELQFLGITN